MAHARQASDWEVDLAAARAVERQVFQALAAEYRIRDLQDRTASLAQLDFSFTFRGRSITLDVKEKRQHYSSGVGQLWGQVLEKNLFVVDETVFRRVVWQGGGGYLAIRDMPGGKWCYFGPWELTLGDHVRYARWGKRYDRSFLKGKLLVNLEGAAAQTTELDVTELLRVVESSERWRDKPEPYPIHGARLREIGERPE